MKEILLAFLIVFVGISIWALYGYSKFGNKDYARSLDRDCGYVIANPQYALVRDTVTGRYAIRFMHIDRFEYYLHVYLFTTIDPYISNMSPANQATTFEDSCKAKAFVKAFFTQEQGKDNKSHFVSTKIQQQ